ncbi:Peptidyl-prolyl cis-trans isomerase cyp15 [Zancudomyces culisetae]|uniref:peptidylprolyl isomerase n=2 Tax=Zancudomyces culisetae TaxID=1213189 RepID=A0A1R1PDG9_ZANCU|nr:Peptidyl-prolyl cis-trans isomerase cyp15 [Zancudomyces culisetae]|eukprot:OMH79034.1 Peptidyl-prolyl cis-trans isomerase cyp15 [Zancudomyces culisetae]
MHRDVIRQVIVTKKGKIITSSKDGHIKFWKKTADDIEFVKDYRAHIGEVHRMRENIDGGYLASISQDDKTVKIFDIENYDMMNIIKLDYQGSSLGWVKLKRLNKWILVVGEEESGIIHKYEIDGTKVGEEKGIHRTTINSIRYNSKYDVVVSCDKKGGIEYWSLDEKIRKDLRLAGINFQYKTHTDLYEIQKKSGTGAYQIEYSNDFEKFSITASDGLTRVFEMTTGKLIKRYGGEEGKGEITLEEMEYGRRLATERELYRTEAVEYSNAVFDQSGKILLYAGLEGITAVELETDRVVSVYGVDEIFRFVNIGIWQNYVSKKPRSVESRIQQIDPTIFTTAFKQDRIYLFSNTENEGERDVFNEKPSAEVLSLSVQEQQQQQQQLLKSTEAIVRTTMGDIHLKLYPELTPKTVHNFLALASKGYYNGTIFHRVIRDFMIQGGDPSGDGTGGESVYGAQFEDEFVDSLRHDKPFTFSMANRGPNTNGSQFFITTVPTPWLDNKHTIFGRAVSGLDVITKIEHLKVDKLDRPFKEVSIVSIDIS